LVPNKKGVTQGGILSPDLFHVYSESVIRTAVLDNMWARVKIGAKNKQPTARR
jgi:hypothetical protein